MERHRYGSVLIFSVIIIFFLGIVSFISCFIAELKKSKVKDLKWDGELCYLAGNDVAFGLGITSLVCVCIGEIIGNFVVCKSLCFCRSPIKVAKLPAGATILLIFSWINCIVAIILLSTATSMSKKQPYGKGWLNEECYLVKDGVFIGSGGLILVTIGLMLGAVIKTAQSEEQRKVHAQTQTQALTMRNLSAKTYETNEYVTQV